MSGPASKQRDRKCASNLQILLCACIVLLFYLFSESNFKGSEGPGARRGPTITSPQLRDERESLQIFGSNLGDRRKCLCGSIKCKYINKYRKLNKCEDSLVSMWQVMKEYMLIFRVFKASAATTNRIKMNIDYWRLDSENVDPFKMF